MQGQCGTVHIVTIMLEHVRHIVTIMPEHVVHTIATVF